MSYLTNNSVVITGDALEDILSKNLPITLRPSKIALGTRGVTFTDSDVDGYQLVIDNQANLDTRSVQAAVLIDQFGGPGCTFESDGLVVDATGRINANTTWIDGILISAYLTPPSSADHIRSIYFNTIAPPTQATLDVYHLDLQPISAPSQVSASIFIEPVSGGTINNYGIRIGNIAGTGAFAIKTNTGPCDFGDIVITSAATTSRASFRIPHGSAPSAPVNGDMWTTTAGLFVRVNGANVGPLS